jgi:hypothetical protein
MLSLFLLSLLFSAARLESRGPDSQTLIDGADFVEVVRLLTAVGESLARSFEIGISILQQGRVVEDLKGVLLQQRMGRSFSQSLVDVRRKSAPVSVEIIDCLLTAQRLGVEQGESLSALSEEFRARARTGIETRAARAPTLMLIPLGCLFLPEIALLWLAGALRDLLVSMG